MSVTPELFLAMSDSAAPMTSWIHCTLYGTFMGSLRPAAMGLLPRVPRSMLPPMMAVLTSEPESNLTQVILVFGSAFSSQPWFFTMRSPLGMSW